MSIKLVTQDLTALPTALLADAKQHMRIDWTYDDEFVKSVLARAIGRFEQINGVGLNVATYEWSPADVEFRNGRAPVPVTPVTDFTAETTATPDATASYTITTDSVFGVPLLYLNGAFASGLVLTLQTGFAALPPPVLDIVLRNAAHLYEHREILVPGIEFVAPDMRIDATWWVPSA
jgi:hypothetical protein